MKRKNLELAEKIFVVIGLTFFSGGFLVGSTTTGPGLIPAAIVSVIRYSVWIISFAIVCLNYKKALHVASQNIFIWIFTLFMYSSSIWSINPGFTERYMVEILQMASFGLYFATRFRNTKQQVRLVAWTFGIGAIVSIFIVWRYPGAGLHWNDHPGAWKGIYDYKNTFGSMMIIGSLAFFLMPVDNLKHRRLKWVFFGLMLVMIYLSTSKTSLIVSFVTISIVMFYHKFRWKGKISVVYVDAVLLFLGSIATIVTTLWVEILTSMGKDTTLTGRIPMWTIAVKELMARPWLGFGRGAFWGEKSKYAIDAGYSVSQGFIPPHAHNGFLDIMLDVGFIGFAIFLISYFITYFRALRLAYSSDNLEDIWPLAYIVFLTLNNLMESYLLRLANIYWVLYIAAACSIVTRKTISANQSYQKTPKLNRLSQSKPRNSLLR